MLLPSASAVLECLLRCLIVLSLDVDEDIRSLPAVHDQQQARINANAGHETQKEESSRPGYSLLCAGDWSMRCVLDQLEGEAKQKAQNQRLRQSPS